jgi:hypothetical protein
MGDHVSGIPGCHRVACHTHLRDPAELGAAIDHTHLHLKDKRRLARIAHSIAHRHVTVKSGAHEGRLDPPLDTLHNQQAAARENTYYLLLTYCLQVYRSTGN